MVQDIRDGIIICKRSPHQRKRRTAQRNKAANASPPSRLPQTPRPIRSLATPKRKSPRHQGVDTESQSQKQRKTTKLRHRVQLHGIPLPLFSQGQAHYSNKASFTARAGATASACPNPIRLCTLASRFSGKSGFNRNSTFMPSYSDSASSIPL